MTTQIYWRDFSGVLQAIIPNYTRLEYARGVNNIGWLTMELDPAKFDTSLLRLNSRLEPWRQVGARTPYLDGETVFFLKKWGYKIGSSGEEVIHLKALDALHLVANPIVAYAAGSAESDQTDYADDMMKEIISHNLGADATDTARSLATWLSVQAQLAAAPSTTKAFSRRNVLAILQELAQESYQAGTYLAFDVVYTSPTALEFRTYTGQRGVDHGRDSGAAVVVSRERKNLEQPAMWEDHENERNYIYCGGQGTEEARTIVTASTADAIGLNRRELFVDARQTSSSDGLDAEANAALFQHRYRRALAGSIIDTPGCRYGVDYNYGDIVYAEYRGQGYDAHVDAVSVVVERGAETVTVNISGEATT